MITNFTASYLVQRYFVTLQGFKFIEKNKNFYYHIYEK